jgi:3-keto-5-aminohexanoate cleavage enzyme
MNRKIIISLAPTSGAGPGDGNPVTPEAIADDVINSIDQGATVVHLHARNERGELTPDLTAFNKSVFLIKESRDIILEASTGGLSTMTTRERILPVSNPQAELGSLNIGSLNFGDQVYRNSLPDVRHWVHHMAQAGVKPSLEVFDTGHLVTALDLIDQGLVNTPCNFSFIFGVRWGMPWDSDLLHWLVRRLPHKSRWGAIFVGSSKFEVHLDAAAAGASFLRVGFEDSRDLGDHMAENNAELVSALRQELEKNGYDLASVAQARDILGVPDTL